MSGILARLVEDDSPYLGTKKAGFGDPALHQTRSRRHPTHEIAWIFLASSTSFAVTLPPASCVFSRIATRL